MNQQSGFSAPRNERTFRSISYTLVFLMMVCIIMTIGTLIHNVLPSWHADVIAGILLFIVVDRLYTYQQLKSLTPLSSEWVIALGAQWALIIILSRFLLSYANGADAFRMDLSLFARGYIAHLFSLEFVITLLFAAMIWNLPSQFLGYLYEIGLDMKLALREDPVPNQGDVITAHQRLVNLIFSTGIFLVILTVLTRLNMRAILANTSGLPHVEVSRFSGAEAGALLYFVFGLALLSLSRLMSLQAHWNRYRIPVSSNNLVRQWGIYSLLFFLLLAVVVSLLPSGDSLGLFYVLGNLFTFLIGILFFIGQFLLNLILLFLSLPFLLFGSTPPMITRPPAPIVLPTPIPESTAPASNGAVWALIKSILLWGSLVVIIVFAIRQFLIQHEGLLPALRKSRITNWLILAWQWLYTNLDRTRVGLLSAFTDGWQSIASRLDGKRIGPRLNFISLRSLDPRRQIYFFYLAMIRRGDEHGVVRKPSQTPSEYALHLENAFPTATEDIDSITDAFIEARYSRQEVDPGKADIVKATWGRIRQAFQRNSKGNQSKK